MWLLISTSIGINQSLKIKVSNLILLTGDVCILNKVFHSTSSFSWIDQKFHFLTVSRNAFFTFQTKETIHPPEFQEKFLLGGSHLSLHLYNHTTGMLQRCLTQVGQTQHPKKLVVTSIPSLSLRTLKVSPKVSSKETLPAMQLESDLPYFPWSRE